MYLSRVPALLGEFRLTPCNLNDRPGDRLEHYPFISNPTIAVFVVSLFTLVFITPIPQPQNRISNNSSHSRDHRTDTRARVLPLGETIIRRTDPDCDSARWRESLGRSRAAETRERRRRGSNASEPARSCTNAPDQACASPSNAYPTPRCCWLLPSWFQGVSRDHRVAKYYTVWHEGYSRYLFSFSVADRKIRHRGRSSAGETRARIVPDPLRSRSSLER